MFVAKADGQVVAYGRVIELAADEAGPDAPPDYYLSGILVEPTPRRQGTLHRPTRNDIADFDPERYGPRWQSCDLRSAAILR